MFSSVISNFNKFPFSCLRESLYPTVFFIAAVAAVVADVVDSVASTPTTTVQGNDARKTRPASE